MVLVVISPADLPEADSLLLFGYHVAKVIPQTIGHRDTWPDFPDSPLKRAASLVQFVGRQRNGLALRLHVISLRFCGS
jgi:hypothetical protein